MSSSDWEEVKRLAADFQRAQLSTTIQRLSERNCVEIITKLLELKLLDVVFTTDGKEYVTPQQICREIRDELFVHGGRVNLVDVAQALGIGLGQIESRAVEISRSDSEVLLVLGQLLDKTYLDGLAEEVNEKLQRDGQVSISDLTQHYDLPADFLQEEIGKRLGSIVHGQRDKDDPRVIFTEAFVARNRAKIRGALSAITKPTSVSSVIKQYNIPERIFFSVIDNLLVSKDISGSLSGGKQSSKAVYIPTIYSKSQTEWVDNFYRQNGYLEFDALSRLGIFDPSTFVKRRFPGDDMLHLSSCCVGRSIVSQVEADVEETLSAGTWLDIMPLLPSVLTPSDAQQILESVVKGQQGRLPSPPPHIFCETFVVSSQFLSGLSQSCDALVKQKAEKLAASGALLLASSESTRGGKGAVDLGGGDKVDKKEERRKKATGGKGGGGTQGRETKTKSVKRKYHKGRGADDFDSDDDIPAVSNKTKQSVKPDLETISVSEIEEILHNQQSLRDCPDELITEIAEHLHRPLVKLCQEQARTLMEATLASSTESRRKTHGELQDKVNTMMQNVRMFEKGLKLFQAKDQQSALAKHLLKTIGTEITNDIFSYVGQENMVQYDFTKTLTPEVRIKLLNDFPKEAKEPLLRLHKSLTGESVDEFLSAVEICLGRGVCEMVVKKPDKKKDKQLSGHRQALLEQLNSAQDPALVLHIAALTIFLGHTQLPIHASGRFVPSILGHLQPLIPAEEHSLLTEYQDLVIKQLTLAQDDPQLSEVKNKLEELMPRIKQVAVTSKKSSTKSE